MRLQELWDDLDADPARLEARRTGTTEADVDQEEAKAKHKKIVVIDESYYVRMYWVWSFYRDLALSTWFVTVDDEFLILDNEVQMRVLI